VESGSLLPLFGTSKISVIEGMAWRTVLTTTSSSLSSASHLYPLLCSPSLARIATSTHR